MVGVVGAASLQVVDGPRDALEVLGRALEIRYLELFGLELLRDLWQCEESLVGVLIRIIRRSFRIMRSGGGGGGSGGSGGISIAASDVAAVLVDNVADIGSTDDVSSYDACSRCTDGGADGGGSGGGGSGGLLDVRGARLPSLGGRRGIWR